MKKLLMTTAMIVAISGAAYAGPGEGKHRDGPPPQMVEALEKLPDAKAQLVKDSFKQLREKRGDNREIHKALRAEIKAILTAEKFDRAAFISTNKKMEALRAQKSQARVEAMADVASQLTAEERTILVDAMGKHWGKRGKGMRHGKHDQ